MSQAAPIANPFAITDADRTAAAKALRMLVAMSRRLVSFPPDTLTHYSVFNYADPLITLAPGDSAHEDARRETLRLGLTEDAQALADALGFLPREQGVPQMEVRMWATKDPSGGPKPMRVRCRIHAAGPAIMDTVQEFAVLAMVARVMRAFVAEERARSPGDLLHWQVETKVADSNINLYVAAPDVASAIRLGAMQAAIIDAVGHDEPTDSYPPVRVIDCMQRTPGIKDVALAALAPLAGRIAFEV